MLNSIYVDNYKTLSNFTLSFDRVQLLVGENGTGKSAILEVLTGLRSLVTDYAPAISIFGTATLTRWMKMDQQEFGITVTVDNVIYDYHVFVQHDRNREQCQLSLEELKADSKTIFLFDGKETHLYRDNGTKGPVYPSDWTRSGLAAIQARHDNKKLTCFKQWLSNLLAVQINPFTMSETSKEEEQRLNIQMENIASWYRYQTQENPEQISDFFAALAEVIQGFRSAKLAMYGERTRELLFHFEEDGTLRSSYDLRFSELSHGQRCLFGAYCVLYFGLRKSATVLFDEPENFVALRELQPLIREISDRSFDRDSQAIIITHSRDIINFLGDSSATYLSRHSDGPTRQTSLMDDLLNTTLEPAELVARGI